MDQTWSTLPTTTTTMPQNARFEFYTPKGSTQDPRKNKKKMDEPVNRVEDRKSFGCRHSININSNEIDG
jgi:hypothetical protein